MYTVLVSLTSQRHIYEFLSFSILILLVALIRCLVYKQKNKHKFKPNTSLNTHTDIMPVSEGGVYIINTLTVVRETNRNNVIS